MATVLLIEDNADIRETLADILQFEGFEVWSAANGRAALLLLESVPTLPHVIILDLKMPVMSGSEFRGKLREHPTWQSVPVVVCSGTLDPDALRGMEPLAGSLRKPVEIPDLLALLATCCSAPPPIPTPAAPPKAGLSPNVQA